MSTLQPGSLFHRHPANPIISVGDLAYPANSVFNAGAASVDGDTVLLMRVEDRRGISHLTVARSADGIKDWRIDAEPTFLSSPKTHPEEKWGIEDPRITYLEEAKAWAVVYVSYSDCGPLVSLATTPDFKHFERHGVILPPENKDAAFFPLRFGGRWAMLHRPVPAMPGGGAHIWISFSPDTRHWGGHRLLVPARRGGWWDANKIGLSPPPLKTPEGWLILYHGVKTTVSGSVYRLGLALLSLDEPWKVIARSDEWIFGPEEEYEVIGDVDKIVFPCGWLLKESEIRLYYGGADKCLALATASLRELLNWLKAHNSMQDV